MGKTYVVSYIVAVLCVLNTNAANIIWQIGKADNSASELALGPSSYKEFLAKDFGYEDRYFLIGSSKDDKDFPYVLPGPNDVDAPALDLYRERHRTLAKCTDDFDRGQFNTAISAMMELVNAASAYINAVEPESRDAALTALVAEDIVSVLAPICPFACEELWHAALGRDGSVYTAPWPEFDVAEAAADEVEIAVQVLGKMRARVMVPAGADNAAMQAAAESTVAKWIDGKTVVKAICVPGKLVNLVVK